MQSVALHFHQMENIWYRLVDNRHVKYWYLEGSRKYKDPIPLMGRSAILGELRNNDFCAVACGKGVAAESTYAITRNGHLVEFNSRRLLDKWVDCRSSTAYCLCTSNQFIFVGCSESIIRVFNNITANTLFRSGCSSRCSHKSYHIGTTKCQISRYNCHGLR